MNKQKIANLIFKSGQIVPVPVKGEEWPPFIDHNFYEAHELPPLNVVPRIKLKTLRFTYFGCQDGIAAYIEQGEV